MTPDAGRMFVIAPLEKLHKRVDFDCGDPALNAFLQRYARQAASRYHSRTFVAVPQDAPATIAGFYTLTINEKRFEEAPKDYHVPPEGRVPVALLAQLAVDRRFQGHGLGELLLIDSLRRCHQVADAAGCCAVEVVAINDRVIRFYEKYGFAAVDSREPHRLYISMTTVSKLFAD